MKRLGLLRHAKSDWDDIAKRDFDRGLNDRGRRGAKLIGEHIREYGLKWDAIRASKAARVRQTLEGAGLAPEPHFSDELYLADSPTIFAAASEEDDGVTNLLIAAHNPGLHEMLFRLVDTEHEDANFDALADKFPTATYAVFELAIDKWADIEPGCGKLIHFARPRDLDPELGPIGGG